MNPRARLSAAVSGTVLLFVCIQLGALALVDPYVAAEAQPVEDPSDPGNVVFFLAVILGATAVILAAIRYDVERLIKGFVLFACGWITWLVVDTLTREIVDSLVGSGSAAGAVEAAVLGVPIAAGALVVLALYVHPEWYVIDGAGVVLGAGAAGLFGLAFTPQLTIAFLLVLAVYDAVSVYGTEHMLTLAEGVSDLNLPVLLVVPTTLSFSLLGDSGPETLESTPADRDGVDDGTTSAALRDGEIGESTGSTGESVDGTGNPADSEDPPNDDAPFQRDAIYIGLGDAVMPTILVASAAYFHRDVAPLYDVPLIAVNAPAAGAMIGTVLGLLALLWLVLRGRAHAGLPLLNGGAIAGYLVGAVAAGIALADALGLPF